MALTGAFQTVRIGFTASGVGLMTDQRLPQKIDTRLGVQVNIAVLFRMVGVLVVLLPVLALRGCELGGLCAIGWRF